MIIEKIVIRMIGEIVIEVVVVLVEVRLFLVVVVVVIIFDDLLLKVNFVMWYFVNLMIYFEFVLECSDKKRCFISLRVGIYLWLVSFCYCDFLMYMKS